MELKKLESCGTREEADGQKAIYERIFRETGFQARIEIRPRRLPARRIKFDFAFDLYLVVETDAPIPESLLRRLAGIKSLVLSCP